MAVIKNHFETTLSGDITLTKHTITGLTAEGSSTNVANFCQECTLYFLKSIYKSLTDAGYTDAIINEEDYSITVLGFKFFIVSCNISTSLVFKVYTYGSSSELNYIPTTGTSMYYYVLNNYNNNSKELSYNIIIRGDKNCVQISYSSFLYPNSEVPLIFIAKSKNFITDKESFCYCSRFYDNGSSDLVYFREKEVLYTNQKERPNYNNYFPTYYTNTGNNTTSKFVCEPILGNYGTYLTYSLLKCNSVNFERGKYYKIGNDLYFCYGYKLGPSASYDGSYLLFKVANPFFLERQKYMKKAIIETLKGDDKNGEKYYIYPVTLESAVIDENGVSLEDKLKDIGTGNLNAEAYSPEEIDGIIDEVWKDQSIGEAGNNSSTIEAYSPEEIDGMIDSIWSSTTAKEAST